MSNDIEAILKATIQTKVVEAFNQTPEMIDKLVEAAMSKEVNQYGGKPDRYGEQKMPYMEWLVGEEIRRAITAAVHDYVKKNEEQINKRVESAMANAEFGSAIGKTMAKILSDEWRWTVSLNVSEDK